METDLMGYWNEHPVGVMFIVWHHADYALGVNARNSSHKVGVKWFVMWMFNPWWG